MSNKFTNRRRQPRSPPICISKPPKPPYPPYPYSAAAGGGPLTRTQQWVKDSTLPPVPARPYEKITVRNLAFHLYPNPRNPAWFRNLHELKKRWPLFNGRRLIAVATGPGLVSPDIIKQYLGPNADYLEISNDPRLRETRTFLPLLRELRSIACNEATFYAHSKGASSHHPDDDGKRIAIRYWRNRMYSELLDRWPAVAATLERYTACGTFKIDYSLLEHYVMYSPTGYYWGNWHFAGNFYWFRHDCIFRNPHWSEIGDDPYAVEMWLGKLLDTGDAHSIYQPWVPTEHPPPDLYNPSSHVDPIRD